MPKKVLIITYYWPPSGGSGVQRWVYFSKYLKKQGIEPIVLTVDPEYATYPAHDESLYQEVENIQVIRTKTTEPFNLYKKIKGKKSEKAVPFGHVETTSLPQKVMAFIRGNFFIPDARKYWKKFALKAAQEVIQKENIGQVITTGPPHSTHLIGLALKNKYRNKLNWIVDFRDPWTEIFYNKDLYRTKRTEQKDLALEKEVLRSADKLIAISAVTADLMRKKLADDRQIEIIPNGYEPFFHEKQKTENKCFTISYVGYLGPHHRTNLLEKGLKEFAAKSTEKIRLHLAGNIDSNILKAWQNIEKIEVVYEGFVSHPKAQEITYQSDLILVSIPYSDYSLGNIPGKVFECLSTGNPIVLIGQKESEAAKKIMLADNTIVLGDDEIDEFVAFLNNVKKRNVLPTSDTSQISPFTRSSLTERLIKNVLNA